MVKSNKKSRRKFAEKFVGRFVGSWAFLLGVVLAFVLGLLGEVNDVWIVILVIIGLIIGLLNISEKETTPFLVSGAILIVSSALGRNVFYNVQVLSHVLDALLIIFIPAIIIVAIRNVFNLAEN